MNRSRSVLSLILTSALVATACSSGSASAPPTAATATTAATAAASGPPASAGSPAAGGSITVTSLWGGSEQESFQKVLDAFKAKTGITAKYESVRDNYATVLQTRITGGNPPDVAILPGIGFLRHFGPALACHVFAGIQTVSARHAALELRAGIWHVVNLPLPPDRTAKI